MRCPVRIFHGSKDDIVPPFVATEVVNWLESKDVQLTMVEGGDHRLSRPEDLRSLVSPLPHYFPFENSRTCGSSSPLHCRMGLHRI